MVLLAGGAARGNIATDPLTAALEKLLQEPFDVALLVSAHGSETGVYAETRGDLTRAGVGGYSWEAKTDPALAEDLARAWGRPMLEGSLDHGAIVPARFLGDRPAVVATIAETTGPDPKIDSCHAMVEGRRLAGAVKRLATDRNVAFIASAHTAASLTPAAPLTEKPEGKQLDDRVIDALSTDVRELDNIPCDLWEAAGSCGAGPLAAFGRLFAGRTADLIAYDHPFGVGYLLAAVRA